MSNDRGALQIEITLLRADTKTLKPDLRSTMYIAVDKGSNPEDDREIIEIKDAYAVYESKFDLD